MSSVCDGHSIYVKLGLQIWAASVPSFPLPGNNSTRSRRAKISILWDKEKEQSSKMKKRKAFTNLCFFFFLSPSSTTQSKGNGGETMSLLPVFHSRNLSLPQMLSCLESPFSRKPSSLVEDAPDITAIAFCLPLFLLYESRSKTHEGPHPVYPLHSVNTGKAKNEEQEEEFMGLLNLPWASLGTPTHM